MPLFSVVVSYYCDPEELKRQLSLWSAFPSRFLDLMEFIVVDDGSPKNPLTSDLLKGLFEGLPRIPRLRAYRLLKDIGFNNLGARNLGAFVALGTYLIFIDMDCCITASMLDHLLKEVQGLGATPSSILYLKRYVIDNVKSLPNEVRRLASKGYLRLESSLSPNSFAMSRHHFWSIGGFNEDLSGRYGTDYEFKRRAGRYGYRRVASKTHILVLKYGKKRHPSRRQLFSGFPSDNLRLPWAHVWSSPSYEAMVVDVDLGLRVVGPHEIRANFPILDLPNFRRTKTLAQKNPKAIFGIDKPIERLPDQAASKKATPYLGPAQRGSGSVFSRSSTSRMYARLI